MRNYRSPTITLALALAVFISGCGTPRENTAPCKRPANLSTYASLGNDCGPMRSINADRAAALAAVQELVLTDQE